MNISRPFINRPIGTALLAFGVAISGIIAFSFLPIAALPPIEFPTISVQASLPGASPQTIASSVATPLEKQLGRIAGVTEMTSTSTQGSTRITVQFELTRNIDGAARDVQAAINAAKSQLPSDLPNQPTYRKVNPADAPIMILALSSSNYTTGQMYDFASTILQQKLSQVEGVGSVTVGGSSLPAVRVELNPTALSHYGIGLNQVKQALSSANVNQPKGQLTQGILSADIIANDQLDKASDYESIIISYQQNAPLRVKDVAKVVAGPEDLRNAGFADGKPAVILIVFKQPSANVITTVKNIKALLPALQGSIPKDIDMTTMMDRTTTIRASLHDVEFTLFVAIALVILVIYLFLKNWRAAIIPSITIPLSLLGTFSIMYFLGFTIDNLSLMALTIATGFVVDDAVVVLENISRHRELGRSTIEAALLGAKEVGFTVLSMSISLIAVFIPILLMGGIVGRLFHEFAITISVAILISLVISLTVTPMMCSKLLPEPTRAPFSASANTSTFAMENMIQNYGTLLRWVLLRENLILLVTLATVLLTIILYIVIPKGFFPSQDTGRITGSIQAQQNISFQAMRKKLKAFVNIVNSDPAVESVTAYVGSGGNKTSNTGNMYITLKPLAERHVSATEVVNRLREKLRRVPAASLYLVPAQDLVVGGRQSNAQYTYSLTAYDVDSLMTWSTKVLAQLSALPELVDVNSDQLNKGLELYLTIDRASAARFGISAQEIDNTLYDAFGQRQISVIYTAMNQYHLVMEVAPEYWQRPDALHHMYVTSSNGEQIPLAAIAHFTYANTLLQVTHQGQFPAANISFNLSSKHSLSEAIEAIEKTIEKMNLPKGVISGSFQGSAKAFKTSLATQPFLILTALIAVYIVLGILYESFIHPLTILSTLPSAGVGALLALLLTGTELTIIALIGIILLIGIVKKNAIMMIDFALTLQREQHQSPRDAIYQACLLRFRPILMTSLAAFLSALPLALGQGMGSELRRPLGIAILGGLLISQLLTLFTTPVVYLALERFSTWIKTRFKYEGNTIALENSEVKP